MTTRHYPVTFVWREVSIIDNDGVVTRRKVMDPLPRFKSLCARQFADDESYELSILEARSRASHNAFFAALHEAFQNLPENIAARFPSEDHLRRWALIETGWCHESEIECASAKLAQQTAALVRSFDGYARISVHGPKVIIRRAVSQSAAAMGRAEFTASKRDVLELIEHMIAVPKGTLRKEVERIA